MNQHYNRARIMSIGLLFLLFVPTLSATASGQTTAEIKYRLLSIGNNMYEVRMKPENVPNDRMVGAVVTIVMPAGSGQVRDLQVPALYSERGARWSLLSVLQAPTEAPGNAYYSYYWDPTFGANASGAYRWQTEATEVVAFTFQLSAGCPTNGDVRLVDNESDPYVNAATAQLDIANSATISAPSAPLSVFAGLYSGPNGIAEANCRAVPGAPLIVAPATGTLTKNNRLTFSGTVALADNVTAVEVRNAQNELLCTTGLNPTLAQTTWRCTPVGPLPEGQQQLRVIAINQAGAISEPTVTTLTVDTTAPTAPVMVEPTAGTIVAVRNPTLRGTGEANSTLYISIQAQSYTTTVDATGQWEIKVGPLANGVYTPLCSATDPAGNRVEAITGNTFTIAVVDSDQDGVSDEDEINILGTDPNNADSDSTMTPANEANNSQSDANEDFDGDGYSNLDELNAGTDPLNSKSTPLAEVNGVYYLPIVLR